MLKITAEPGSTSGRILRIEGRLAGPWVDELQHHCESALAEGLALTLDLSGTCFADPDGRRLLRELAFRSVALVGRTPFIAAQLGGEPT